MGLGRGFQRQHLIDGDVEAASFHQVGDALQIGTGRVEAELGEPQTAEVGLLPGGSPVGTGASHADEDPVRRERIE